ncbi:MAG: hypothetical protein AAF714_02415 [Pseudomonadota bacterium]
MQKGLAIVAAFCVVTMGLILLQPKRSPEPGLQLPTLRVDAPAPEVTAEPEVAEVAPLPETTEEPVIAAVPEPEPELAPLVTALRPVLRPEGLVPEEAPVAEERLAASVLPEVEATPEAIEDAPSAPEPALAELAPPVETVVPSIAEEPATQELASEEPPAAPLVEVPAEARTALAALPAVEPAPEVAAEPVQEPVVVEAPVEPPVTEETAPDIEVADVAEEPDRAITQVIAGLLRGALSVEEPVEEIAEDEPVEEVAASDAALPPNAALFADMAAARPQLIIATGTDADGRIGPSLRSMAHNTKIYPSETANRPDSLLSLDINSDRSVAEAAVTASPVAVARSYSSGTITLTTRMANSPATLPVAGPLVPTVEASAEFAAQGQLDETPLFLDGPSDAVATLAAPEEVGNAALRARLADAPTRAIHTVRLGDSLLTLALRYYGDPEKAEVILEANRRHLNEDGSLLLGQIVRIPDIDNL